MKNVLRASIAFSLLSVVGLVGVTQIANAKRLPMSMNPDQMVSMKNEIGDGDGETKDDQEEISESKNLQALAKITPQQAQQSAIGITPGTVQRVMLENEDGNLVYAVTIGQKEVKVDAGNARVLYSEAADGKNELEDEKTDAARPRSSIQVPGEKSDGEDANK